MSIFQELKRRNVIRVALAYIIVAWLILQVGDVVLGNIGTPSWVFQTILLVLALGLPLAIIFAWAFELTPDGLKREREVDRSASVTHQTGRKLDRAIIVVLVIALGYFAWDKFAEPPADEIVATFEKASIAVLPFVNMSSDPEQEYFSDGISEELLNLLAKIPQFQVAGRTSSFEFKGQNDDLREIGERLGVSNILEGSVRKGNDRVRITAQLVKVDDGFHLWSDTYDRELTDVFQVQDEIANAVVNELKLTLLGAEIPTIESAVPFTDAEAHNHYLQGLYYMNRLGPDNSAKAAAAFQKAVDLAPDSALAWASLAGALARYAGQAEFGADEALAESRVAVAKALELDEDVPEAHIALANIAFSFDWDWPAADAAIDRALELRPGDVRALHLRGRLSGTLGRKDEALALYRELLAKDPLDGSLPLGLIASLVYAGELEEAEAMARRLVEQDPDANFVNAYLSWVLEKQGKHDEALEYARKEPVDFVRMNAIGFVHFKMGNDDAAIAIQEELEAQYGDSAAYQQASISSASGYAELTLSWLERAYEARDPGMTAIKTDPDFEFLHDNPRFIRLLEKMNLAD
jgi:serine/threonine-protein kinase